MKKILSAILLVTISANIFGMLGFFSYLIFEPEEIQAVSSNVYVNLAVTGEVSVACSTSTEQMDPAISGMTGGTANGQTTCTVITNNETGFNMTLYSTTSPAMKCISGGCSTSADYFASYTPANNSVPDYDWAVAAANSEFGYTVEPATAGDTATMFKDNGSTTCNQVGGTNTANSCWNYASTTAATIISRTTATAGGGEAEVIKFRAESGASHFQPEGNYQATIILTTVVNS